MADLRGDTLLALGNALMQFPELRVGQLIDNAVYHYEQADIFNISDAELTDALNLYVKVFSRQEA